MLMTARVQRASKRQKTYSQFLVSKQKGPSSFIELQNSPNSFSSVMYHDCYLNVLHVKRLANRQSNRVILTSSQSILESWFTVATLNPVTISTDKTRKKMIQMSSYCEVPKELQLHRAVLKFDKC